jgi:hypothetical protein
MLLNHLLLKNRQISFEYVQEMLLNLFVYLYKNNKIVRKNFFFFYLTFGTQGNSFISNVDAGSMLDASLANDVVDSAELNDGVGVDGIIVPESSSSDGLFPPVDPSSLAASESKADCFVKLYLKKESTLG